MLHKPTEDQKVFIAMYKEKTELTTTKKISTKEALEDYYIAFLSRQLSILGRREVHNGRAHFGIFGDGKEVAQILISSYTD